jgi:hypothetical protein
MTRAVNDKDTRRERRQAGLVGSGDMDNNGKD